MILKTYRAVYDNGILVWENEERPVETHARVMITILEPLGQAIDDEQDAWHRISMATLAEAYGDDEPNYTADDIRFR